MKVHPALGRTIAALALACVALLTGCSTPPPPPPPPAAPPAAPPPISLSDGLVRAAAAYRDYVTKSATMSPAFTSGAEVADSLKFGDSYDPDALVHGEIAYAAVVALQDPRFVASVRAFAVDPTQRRQIAAAIMADPNYVQAIKGSDSAAGLVVAALLDEGQKMVATGASVKQAAYDIQHQAWSKETVANRDQRLADAKSGSPLTSTSDEVAQLQSASVGAAPLAVSGAPLPPPYTPLVSRGLAVAALAALGAAGDEDAAAMAPIMSDTSSSKCLSMAKLNLYQCLAVSRPHYEDVFCLGEHVLTDTGQCLMYGAGAPVPVVAPLPVSKTETAYNAKPATKKKRHKRA